MRRLGILFCISTCMACGLITGLSDYDSSSSDECVNGGGGGGGGASCSDAPSGTTDAPITATSKDTGAPTTSPPVDSGSDVNLSDDTGIVLDANGPPTWTHKRKLTVALGVVPTGGSTMPVLVRLDATRISYAVAKANGGDLRFTDKDGKLLPYEIEHWNSGGDSRVWVQVPAASPGNVDITMFYGNTAAADGQTPVAVWPSYLGVWHLVDAHDSTGKHASVNGATGLAGASLGALQSGTATSFTTGQVIDTGVNETLPNWTIEVSFNATNPTTSGMNPRSFVSRDDSYQIEWDCTTPVVCKTVNVHVTSGQAKLTSYGDPSVSVWHNLIATYDGNTVKTYLDGASVASTDINGAFTPASKNMWIGRSGSDNGESFIGGLDEVRISTTARSATYAAIDQKSRADTLISYGPDVANPLGTLTP